MQINDKGKDEGMAEDIKNKTISKNDTGFPGYLNFDTLRRSAIEYLGKLSGKVWTDHNVHDPGITMLEVLIYALLDLGYRTNLPVEDLFSRNPDDHSADDNFFTANRILANNPLTILDYRKLLVDIEGVKNAWLEIDTHTPVQFCPPEENAVGVEFMVNNVPKDPCACDTLNGLYHVYLQLDDEIEKNKNRKNALLSKVKKALMAHRNLCEDFVDIQVLCSLEIGVCVDIELSQDADAASVYFKMVEVLQEYFSPSPRFYSLQQMLDKGRTIDEIFAGRPFNITESHGFTDAVEFEALTLKKELHLSDVYNILSAVEGVESVRNLGWITCCEKKEAVQNWKLALPENHIPKFSTSCSGFVFSQKGLPVNVDVKGFEDMLKLITPGNQKALYKADAPFLNPEIKKGIYRSDLADYYSIQNDLPDTYGIKEGGLDSKAPAKRKAQALQLQAFLLFFDQLLANYLTQLKNIRSLFSLSSSGNKNNPHTYFTNQLKDVPQLQKLLRFRGAAADSSSGDAGGVLAYPTSKQKIAELINNGKLKAGCASKRCNNRNDDEFPGYKFCFAAERDQAILQIKDDLINDHSEIYTASDDNEHYLFYIFTSSDKVALISKSYYKTATEAFNAAASLKYISSFAENYQSFVAECCENNAAFFSFDINFNLDTYANFLEQIVESKQLYATRRQDFLNHLLARFAERFTDYALLSSSFLSADELGIKQIGAEERFLSHYDDISSNRGKGYDYLKYKWGNENISGFEKRTKALAGIENWKQHTLCNFIVEKADALYRLSVILFNEAFTVTGKMVTYKEAMASLQSLFKKLLSPEFQEQFVAHEDKWQVYVTDDFGNKYASRQLFATNEEAETFSKRLTAVFKFEPDFKKEVFVNAYIYKMLFTDHEGKILAESKAQFNTKDNAVANATRMANKMAAYLNDAKSFSWLKKTVKPEKLLPVNTSALPFVFIDEKQFVPDYRTKPYLKLEKTIFSVYNKITTIQFNSLKEYDNKKLAGEDYQKLLVLIVAANNYTTIKNKQTDKWQILIGENEDAIACYFEEYAEEEVAKNKIRDILAEVAGYTYQVNVTDAIASEWEFNYQLQDTAGNVMNYVSTGNYADENTAIKNAAAFYANIPAAKAVTEKNNTILQLQTNDAKIKMQPLLANTGEADAQKAKQLLEFKQEVFVKINNAKAEDFNSILEANRINPGEDYIYKLVDKDNLVAYYPAAVDKDPVAVKDELVSNATKGYNYIQLDFDNCINERKDTKSKKSWFHFQLVCTNRWYTKGKLSGKKLVLVESVLGYSNKEDAIAAFNNIYLQVLKYARNKNNYGNGKPISTTEVLIQTDEFICNNNTIVFIPAATSDEFNGDAVKFVVPLASSYPVYFIRKNKYRFVIGQVDDTLPAFKPDWVSKKIYNTVLETRQQLQFCLMLLKYPGNFFIEENSSDCKTHIYIREVLALSAHGFDNPENAWKEGVEKFICIAQTKTGFHNYFNQLHCSNSFFVACGNTGLIHPCTYDTAKRRNDIITELFKARTFNFLNFIKVTGGQLILNDRDNNPLAKIITDKANNKAGACESLVAFAAAVYDDSNYVKEGQSFYLRCSITNEQQLSYYKIAEPCSKVSLKEWKAQLKKMACYFPIIAKTDACAQNGANPKKKYFVEIKLPGFNCCDDGMEKDPCDCGCAEPDPCKEGCKVSCEVAWKSDCCFDTCCEALDFYIYSFILLQQHENYKPLYDCNEEVYSIGLYAQLTLNEEKKLKSQGFKLIEEMNTVCRNYEKEVTAVKKDPSFCLNDIAAFNPQRYNNELEACQAASRARALINAEGLHLVEHILLRPRCKDEKGQYKDACCDAMPQPCLDEHVCHFQWKPGDDVDPCTADKVVCFTPGCDPYSFIATIALPAWPERFRSVQSREIIEKLLQREAPAHVLLRILWLNPRDLCCFEFYFKQWKQWMAGKHRAEKNIANCDFLKIIFRKSFDDLQECDECNNCSCDEKQSSCLPVSTDPCEAVSITQKINALFCWSQEKMYSFSACEGNLEKKNVYNIATPVLETVLPAPIMAAPIAVPVPIEAPIATPSPKGNDTERADMFRTRAKLYRTNIGAVAEENTMNEMVPRALTLLKKAPLPHPFAEFMKTLLGDKGNKEKNIKTLTAPQKKILIDNLTWNYLDQVCFEKNVDMEKIVALHPVLQLIKKNKIDTGDLYAGWKADALNAYESSADFKKIKKTLGGS